ncbi:response regulator transcription factor [bacterium]|nr:response regulator transcription factor [bacterium]
MNKGRVLLVEDDELIGSTVELNLKREGYEVDWTRLGEPATRRERAADVDLIILDIMLPDTDGVTILKHLREAGVTTPVMMMTAREEVETKIGAFETGADDYLTKPFHVKELLARANALIRRSQSERHLATSEILHIGPYRVNPQTRHAETREGPVQLTAKEVDLLAYFLRGEGVTRSRADILEEVWGMEVYVSERTIDNFIVRFRRLFEEDPDNPRRFVTVRGVGYRFERVDS